MIRLERRPYCPILSNLLSGWRDLDRLQSTIRRPQSENSHSRLSNPFASTRAQQHPGLFWTAVSNVELFPCREEGRLGPGSTLRRARVYSEIRSPNREI